MTDGRVIGQALTRLSNPHRALIYRAYYLKRTTAEIAAEWDVCEETVRSLLHDAMQELRRILVDADAA